MLASYTVNLGLTDLDFTCKLFFFVFLFVFTIFYGKTRLILTMPHFTGKEKLYNGSKSVYSMFKVFYSTFPYTYLILWPKQILFAKIITARLITPDCS